MNAQQIADLLGNVQLMGQNVQALAQQQQAQLGVAQAAAAAAQAAAQAVPAALPGAVGGGRRKLTIFSSGNPTDWKIWRRNFVQTALINGWQDQRQRREAVANIEGIAATSVSDIEPDNYADIQLLLEALEARFLPAAQTQTAKTEFNLSKQKPGETVIQWHARLRELFIRAYPARNPINDDQLIDKFVSGLYDRDVMSFILDRDPNTYAAALEHAQRRTSALLVLARNKGGTNGTTTNPIAHLGQEDYEDNSYGELNAIGRNQCWYCRKAGHLRDDCQEFIKGRAYFAKYFKMDLNKFLAQAPARKNKKTERTDKKKKKEAPPKRVQTIEEESEEQEN